MGQKVSDVTPRHASFAVHIYTHNDLKICKMYAVRCRKMRRQNIEVVVVFGSTRLSVPIRHAISLVRATVRSPLTDIHKSGIFQANEVYSFMQQSRCLFIR